jgi:DNA repair ATPase RecN
MNTEVKNALAVVREAEHAIDAAREEPDLDPAINNQLQEVYDVLLDIDDHLVLEDLKDGLQTLQQHSDELKKVSNKINKSIKDLKEVSDAVAKAAKIIGTLVEIASKAASSGLI